MSTRKVFKQYDERYVAFLDILGFTTMVNGSQDNPDLIEDIQEALEFLYKNKADNEDNDHGLVKLGRMISVFSDSIYISYDASAIGAGIGMLQDILYIVENLLYKGFLVRGGLTYGKIIHTESVCYGPAVNHAYELESMVAIYPRVVIDGNVREQVLSRPLSVHVFDKGKEDNNDEEKLFSEMAKIDNDGIHSLNYLGYGKVFDDDNEYYLQLCKVKEIIGQGLREWKGNPKLYMKYQYLKDYFNDVIISIGDCEELRIV